MFPARLKMDKTKIQSPPHPAFGHLLLQRKRRTDL